MAYQVLLMHFNNGEVALSPSAPLLDVLRRYSLAPRGGEEFVVLSDGLNVDLYTDGLVQAETQEIGLTFRGTSDELYRLIYALMCAGSLTALLVDNPTVPLVLSREQGAALLESDMAEAVVVQSPDDVRQALDPLFGKWAQWAGVE